jgi:hypothetical protein
VDAFAVGLDEGVADESSRWTERGQDTDAASRAATDEDAYLPEMATDGAVRWSEAAASGDGPTLCTGIVPSGWSPVIYASGDAACPGNFATHDVLGPSSAGAGACSCACSMTHDGTCTQGTLAASAGVSGGSCTVPVLSQPISGSSCTALGTALPVAGQFQMQATPLPLQTSACADSVHADPTKVSAPTARYCDVPKAIADSVCSDAPPPGFLACIMTIGPTGCPAGTSFLHSYVVEDSTSLQC